MAQVPAASGSMPNLTYFDGRGHGHRVRYALAGAGIQWTETPLKQPDDLQAARQHCLFGQVPLLEIDGLKLVQSWTIVRYIGCKDQLPPESAWVADAWSEQVRDFYTDAGFLRFGWNPDKAPGLAQAGAAASRYLRQFEQVLSSAFVTGPSPCWADFQLLLALDFTVDLLGSVALQPYPKLTALREALRALPRMQQFYGSPHYKGLVDAKYMAEVKAVMAPPAK